MAEKQEELRRNHLGGKSLANKIMLQGYFRPTMVRDSERYAKNCEKCKRFAPMHYVLSNDLTFVPSSWPFIQWGMDIVGPLPQDLGQKKYILVAIDYFSKWVRAESYANIKD